MMPLFCDDIEISASSPSHALEMIARAGIAVYGAERIAPGKLKIRVKCKETKKIFAIFRGSCYTVTKDKRARLAKVVSRALRRPGILAGAALFALGAFFVNVPVLRIDVYAAYSATAAREVLAEAGIRPLSLCSEAQAEEVRRALLSLPGVVFASVEKEGCVLTVRLQEEQDTPLPSPARSLSAPRAGVVEELTVLRGTALVSEGDAVEAGQELAAGYFLTESGEKRETFAVARCALLCEWSGDFYSEERSEDAAAGAIAAAQLSAGGELVSARAEVRAEGEGYVYRVTLTVRVFASVNME